MSALSAAKTILEADATLLATATGGVWDFDETGRLGLSRTLTGGAFDSNGILKPCLLLKLRSSTPDSILADDATKYVSVREMLEVWFYQDTGYSSHRDHAQSGLSLYSTACSCRARFNATGEVMCAANATPTSTPAWNAVTICVQSRQAAHRSNPLWLLIAMEHRSLASMT